MGNRKQKDKLNFWLKMWSGSFKKFEFGIWLRNKTVILKVVAYEKWSL